jgi:ATP-dependent Zn protease
MRTVRRTSTAYHEAGHAVAAFTYHKRLHRVSIQADHDAGLLGYVKLAHGIGEAIAYADPEKYLRRVTENVVISLAGVVAEQEHTRGKHNWAGADRDRHNAADLASYVVSDEELAPYVAWLMVRARVLIKWHWRAVDALAQELLVREEMTGAEATAFIRRTFVEDVARMAADFAGAATR